MILPKPLKFGSSIAESLLTDEQFCFGFAATLCIIKRWRLFSKLDMQNWGLPLE